MPKVLISDKLSPAAIAIFKDRGVEVDVKTGLSPAELRAIIGEYDGLAIRSATKVTREVLDAATNLKVVGRAGIGVDNVDVKGATSRGVVVMNTIIITFVVSMCSSPSCRTDAEHLQEHLNSTIASEKRVGPCLMIFPAGLW